VCRITAISRAHTGGLSQAESYILATALVLSSRCGNTHGVGVATNSPGGSWLKSGNQADDVVFEDSWNKWWKDADKDFDTIIGHNRLASLDWRTKGNTYPTAHAHPHEFQKFTMVHNGMFEKYKEIAKTLSIPDDENLTDTSAFIQLLAEYNQEKFSTKGLIAALKAAGEAQYSMIIQHSDEQDVFVVRGNRTLFVAESNYGLLINTTAVNLNDLVETTRLGLLAFGFPAMEMEKPKDLDNYTLYRLRSGKLDKVLCFEEEVKDINAPKKVVNTYNTAQQRQANNQHSNNREVCDADQIGARTMAILGLFDLLPKVSEEHHRLAMLELYGDGAAGDEMKHPTLHHFESEQLIEYLELVTWAQEHFDSFTAEKYLTWSEFTNYIIESDPEITTERMYVEASHLAGVQVDIPYFFNEVSVLRSMVEGALH
jgi:hypothetical protein